MKKDMSAPLLDQLHTLVLSVGYEPIHVVSWRRAFSMVYTDRAMIVEEYDHVLRSPSTSIKAPSVIRLVHSVKRYRPKVRKSKRAIFERDDFRCQYCAKRLPVEELTVDHVVPKSKGGSADWSNSVTACRSCNNKKGNRTPKEAGMHLIQSPGVPRTEPYLLIRRTLGRRVSVQWVPYLFWDVSPDQIVPESLPEDEAVTSAS